MKLMRMNNLMNDLMMLVMDGEEEEDDQLLEVLS